MFCAQVSPQCLGARLRQIRRRKQRADIRLSSAGLIMGLVYHHLRGAGLAAVHVAQVTRAKVSGSRISQRAQELGMDIFEWVMGVILGPRAHPKKQPQAFYRGMRLVGIDGSLFSVFNTRSVLKQMSKALSRRLRAAFAKLGVVSLVELGTHRPIAAAISRDHESEMALATRLVAMVPLGSLLLADRLYGVGKFLVAFLKLFAGQSDFLVRVKKSKFKSRIVQCLRDGSVILDVWSTNPESRKKGTFWVREIRGTVIGRGRKRTTLRLWTSLLEWKDHPALELLKLYAQRWEQELSFNELKIDLRGGPLLHSYTPITARQEIAALLIAQALLADCRLEAARRGEVPVLRISFLQVLQHVRALWQVLSWGGNSLTEKQKHIFTQGMFHSLLQQLSAPRRPRSCRRVIRQPVSSWPRKLKNGGSTHGQFRYEISRQFKK